MKAIRIHEFGGPEVLRCEEVPEPMPDPDEIRIKVIAAGVNPVDWKIRRGLIKLPLPITMGFDVAGLVDAKGPDVRKFQLRIVFLLKHLQHMAVMRIILLSKLPNQPLSPRASGSSMLRPYQLPVSQPGKCFSMCLDSRVAERAHPWSSRRRWKFRCPSSLQNGRGHM